MCPHMYQVRARVVTAQLLSYLRFFLKACDTQLKELNPSNSTLLTTGRGAPITNNKLCKHFIRTTVNVNTLIVCQGAGDTFPYSSPNPDKKLQRRNQRTIPERNANIDLAATDIVCRISTLNGNIEHCLVNIMDITGWGLTH